MTTKPRIRLCRPDDTRYLTRYPDGSYRPVTAPSYHRGRTPASKGKTFPATPPTPDEMLRLLATLPDTRVGRRNRALFIVQWRVGLRCSESLDLLPPDIDLEQGAITVLHGKGDKRRVVGIDTQAAAELRSWLDERASLGYRPDQPVFCTLARNNPGNRLWGSYVREVLTEHARRAGIHKRIRPHQLRHACACDMAREGVPLHLIQRQLGHADLGMTAKYLAGISGHEVVTAMASRSWGEAA